MAKVFSHAELGSEGDEVLLAIGGKVYDFAQFVADHPGGASLITEARGE